MPSIRSYDMTITDGTNTVGVMLYRPIRFHRASRKPIFFLNRNAALMDAHTIAPRTLTTAELDQAQLPPDLQSIDFEENWQGGIGGVNHRLDKPKYQAGTQLDATGANMAQMSRRLFTSTVDVNPTAYSSTNFAIWGNASTTESWAWIGREPYLWNYSTKQWIKKTAPVAATRVYRDGLLFAGVAYQAAWAEDVGSGGLYTGSDLPTTYVYKNTADATWTQIAVSAQTDVLAFKYITQANGKLWCGYTTTGAAYAGRTFTTSILSDATTNVVVDATTGIVVGDVIRLAFSTTSAERELMLVTALVDATNITVIRGYRGTVKENHISDLADKIYKITTNVNEIRSATSATSSSSWSSAVTVGDTSSEITAIVGDGSLVYIYKTDGVYTYDGTTVVYRTPDMVKSIHPQNFRGAIKWNNKHFLPVGGGGLLELEITNYTVRDISFAKIAPNYANVSTSTDLSGRVVSLTADSTHLYALVYDITNLRFNIMMAQLVSISGTSDYRWHHLGEIDYTSGPVPNHCCIYVGGEPSGPTASATSHHRLLIGIESTGANLLPRYQPIDGGDAEDEITNATGLTASAGGELIALAYDANLANVAKLFKYLTVTSKNATTGAGNSNIIVQYRVDGGAWTYVTGVQASSTITSTPQTLNFPTGASSVTGKMLELKFLFVRQTAATAISPQLLTFTLTCGIRPVSIKEMPVVAYLADGMRLLNGAIGGKPSIDLAQLQVWDDTAAEVTVVDTTNTSRAMVFLPGRLRQTELSNEANRRREYLVSFLLAAL